MLVELTLGQLSRFACMLQPGLIGKLFGVQLRVKVGDKLRLLGD